MKRIAIVNQRYGSEVNGGSEYYARLIAEHLNKYYNVEVLTTTARDYDTWDNYYDEGVEQINGVSVCRFPVKHARNMRRFRVVNKITRILEHLGISMGKWWSEEQGPYSPQLIEYIRNKKAEYDLFIFVTYLYYPTVVGLPFVADKAILIPTAHDEPYIYFKIYKKIFELPRAMIFLTEEERTFVQNTFNLQNTANDVIGVGIEVPMMLQGEKRKDKVDCFRTKYSISGEYIIYVGRVDVGKKCDEMIQYFEMYKEKHPENEIQLVVIGKVMMDVHDNKDIHYLGFVSEDDKYAGIVGAKFLWLPSRYESFSIALLEAMALGVPGIVNGNCDVLKGHCERSGGSFYYNNEADFEKVLYNALNLPEKEYLTYCKCASDYAIANYQWNQIERKLTYMMENAIHVIGGELESDTLKTKREKERGI